jgi:hypothetical protein
MPPDGPASWPAADSRRQWIVFYKADGMTLAGKGTIEGNGEEWWDLPCKPHQVRTWLALLSLSLSATLQYAMAYVYLEQQQACVTCH